jgi:hypothetical protein
MSESQKVVESTFSLVPSLLVTGLSDVQTSFYGENPLGTSKDMKGSEKPGVQEFEAAERLVIYDLLQHWFIRLRHLCFHVSLTCKRFAMKGKVLRVLPSGRWVPRNQG